MKKYLLFTLSLALLASAIVLGTQGTKEAETMPGEPNGIVKIG